MDQMSGPKGKVRPKMKNARSGTGMMGNKPKHSMWSCQDQFRSIAVN